MIKQHQIVRIIIVLLLAISANSLQAQDSTRVRVYNVLWVHPTSANKINGVAFGGQALNLNDQPLTINGLNADLGVVAFVAMGYVLDAYLHPRNRKFHPNDSIETPATVINGCSISFGGEIAVSVNGVNLAGISTMASEMKGVSITGGFSFCGSFKGLLVGGITNDAINGTGLQIGLFNRCKKLKGLQIGLWNKSGKRGLPILNWGT